MGGNAIPISKKLPAGKLNSSKHDFWTVMDNITGCVDAFHPIGSTFKKSSDDEYGDIDLCMDTRIISMESIQNILQSDNRIEEITMTGGNLSFSLPWDLIEPGADFFVQVDIMPTEDPKYTQFLYHSPDFQKDESRYKGVHRNILLFNIARNVKNIVLSEWEPGNPKEFKKPAFTPAGLMEQYRTYEGAGGKELKNPKKKGERLISRDPDEVIKYILGEDSHVADANSFESLWIYIMQGPFPEREQLKKIASDAWEAFNQNSAIEMPTELKFLWG